MIKILAFGDIIGKAGRKTLVHTLSTIPEAEKPDILIVNGENVAGGFGITHKIFKQLIGYDVDCVTTGNHWADKREIFDFMDSEPRLLIPANMGNVDREEAGLTVLTSRSGVDFAVINLSGRAFMHPSNRNPFAAVDRLLDKIPAHVKIRVVDMHAEATSEKQGIGHYVSGRASLVYGTHSHVPTADERILNGSTGYATDIGMTGAYDSVIGMEKEASLKRLMTGEKQKFKPATKDCWGCYLSATIDPSTGNCQQIKRHKLVVPVAK